MSVSMEQFQIMNDFYNLLNKRFFNGELPEVVLLIDYHTRTAAGYFSYEKFTKKSDSSCKVSCIGLNPDTFYREAEYVLEVLLHEMCHCYECYRVHKAPKDGYHTKIWASRMKEVGLDPVFLNKSRTKVTDKPIEGGLFIQFLSEVPNKEKIIQIISTVTQQDSNPEGTGNEKGHKGSKVKYACKCGNNVWGKPGLKFYCPVCKQFYLEDGYEAEEDNEEGDKNEEEGSDE
jgi:predicted SprT family Zn-dependent metalloprotease